MTIVHLAQTGFWMLLVAWIALLLGALWAVIDWVIEPWMNRAFTEREPTVDDVTERRRAKADAFAARRQQLQSASMTRVRR